MRRKRALILGLGRFGGGVAAAAFLRGQGYRLRIADRAQEEQLSESVQALSEVSDIEWTLGREDPGLLDGVDLLVCNPAVPPNHPLLADATTRGVRVTQEVNLFLESYPGKIVAVTGTNGKSTTANLIARALGRDGVETLLGGNIGHSLLLEKPRWNADQVAVLEISSAQLQRIDPTRHRIEGAVFTRITQDHLDWHGSLDAYHAAKARAAAMADEFVVCSDEDTVAERMEHGARQMIRYGSKPGSDVRREGNRVWSDLSGDPGPILDTPALRLPGEFQVENVMAACAAVLLLGGHRHSTAMALATSTPLPFRLQLAAAVAGRKIYDNSVSTQVESTLSALENLPGSVHWVGGGKSKDNRFQEPGGLLSDCVTTAHLFGSSAARLGPVMSAKVTTTVHDDLEEALDAAWAESEVGETILFSPAFASFDQFPNFTLRAARFATWVHKLRARHGDSSPTTADGSGPAR